ncbi:MAG: antibiotic biosynthesis monooxygenase [Acidobacteria bacterium]|nr:antibiotic biosynthesis monooxygenase [Acidobacteriota bacterium]
MSDPLHLIAMFTAKPGKAEALRELLEGLIEPTRAEPGCLDYRLMADGEDEHRFVFVEEWRDDAALDAHFETSHLQEALTKFPELLDGELELRRLKLVE